ncbi:MAG: M20/M25/M40 family metallo-hydrolase [Chloroflexi bacterium]|nr:M20/M25/M40 family metallo-hydrolase [Chloroflexota bacterium]
MHREPLARLSHARLVELTETLVAIPSVTGNEQAMADWLAAFLHTNRASMVQRLAVPEAGDTVFGRWDGPADGPVLMLNLHLDTFDAFAGWQTPPFTPTTIGDRLYGLGAHDMKGGAACLLAAVEAVIRSGVPLGGTLIVSGTSDEENWSRGAHALLDSGLLARCGACLVPEPSATGTLTIGQRGRHVFRIRLHGQSMHAAFGRGINAVSDAARIAALLADPAAVELGYDPAFDLSGSLCVIGLHGGGTLIVVPEAADLFIDRHLLPGQTVADAAAQLHAVVAQAGIEGHYALTWDERPTPAPGAFLVPPGSPLVQLVQRHLEAEHGGPVRLVLGRSVADTSHFAVHGGIPTLICGPDGGNTCMANEYVQLSTLLPIARTYVRTIIDYLGGAA